MDDHVDYILRSAERKEMVIDLNLYGLETLIQDVKSFTPRFPESLLNKVINKFEDMQNKLYQGTFGLESTTKIRNLDSLIVEQKCRMADVSKCENIVENVEIDFTKDMMTAGLNELVDEYISKSKSILQRSQIKQYKDFNRIYNYELDIDRFRNECLDDADFLFQYNSISHVINGLDQFYNILFDNLFATVKETKSLMILFVFLGGVLVIISFIISYGSIKSTKKILQEMSDTIFIIPKSTVNMVPQLKRFIETASFEEE